MRNLKKFLALVLATLMVISAAATVSAYSDVADDNTYAAAINALTEYGIVNGIGDDQFGPDNDVVRYQMAIMMARALEPKTTDWQNGMAIFEDVTEWYGAIGYAYMNGIVTGMDATHFEPYTGIKCRDALIMAVRALGYKVDTTLTPYWIGAYQTAAKLGLTKDLQVTDPAKTLTRAETAQVIYNMLKATPADGGATIEEKNFGVAGETNVTTFVITATANQAYAEGAKAAEAGYVGIQPLVNGIPNGDITYLPAEVLGIDADEVDDYFNYAVDLVNYVEKTGMFDKAILGADPTVVYSASVSVSSPKITVNGTVYYPAAEITGAALKNEIVVYAGGADARESRILLKDSDGDIINQNGVKQAIFAYQSANGTKYYADKLNNKVISESAALATYGVIVEGSYTEYATMTAADLGNNYQLTLFDDDGNGKFDRAIYTPVYMSVYNNPSDGKVNIKSDAFTADTKNVKFSETLKKGDVFVYTYNGQLKKVNVIEKLSVQTGKIDSLDLTNYKAQSNSKNWFATVTIDGVKYKIGNTAQEMYIGAKLCATDTAPTSVADIANNARIGYKNSELSTSNVVDTFAEINSPIKFIAFNDYIIYAETYSIEDAFDYMVVVDAENYDTNGVYVNAYINGIRGSYLVSQFTDGENTVAFADLSVFKLNYEISRFVNDIDGAVFKTVALGDGSYKVSEAFDKTVDNNNYNETFKLYKSTDVKLAFNDGISDLIGDKGARLRTNADTKFYFINESDGTISLFTGKVADKYTINARNIEVFADKIGYGSNSAKNGVAKFVLVYYTNDTKADIEGFNLSSITNAIVYVANPGTYTVDSAANLGLTGKSGTYFKYGTVAINMANGEKMAVYTAKNAPLARGFYVVDGAGIATALTDSSKIDTVNLTSSQIDLNDQYITISGVAAVKDKVTKLVSVSYKDLTVKTDKTYFGSTAVKAQFLKNDTADGIVVLVVGADAPVVPTDPEAIGVANAKYVFGKEGESYAAMASIDVAADGAIKGTVTLYDAKGAIGDTIPGTAKKATGSSDEKIFKITKVVYKSNADDAYKAKAENNIGIEVKGSFTNGVVTIDKVVDSESPLDRKFEKGYYGITFEFTTQKGSTVNVTVYFDVQ